MKRNAVIFDMDGTLCDVTSVRHHVLGKRKNFDAFHYGSIWCPPTPWVAEALHEQAAEGRAIIVVTAREERWGILAHNWITHHGLFYDELHMRPTGDFRPDTVIKRELHARFASKYNIVHAYDDNPSIVALWRELGIPTTIVPGWAEERE